MSDDEAKPAAACTVTCSVHQQRYTLQVARCSSVCPSPASISPGNHFLEVELKKSRIGSTKRRTNEVAYGPTRGVDLGGLCLGEPHCYSHFRNRFGASGITKRTQ